MVGANTDPRRRGQGAGEVEGPGEQRSGLRALGGDSKQTGLKARAALDHQVQK